MAFNIGEMSPSQLDKYIKGWGAKGAEVIDTNMQAGSLLESAFPAVSAETERAEFFVTAGNPGLMGVALDGAVDSTKWEYKRLYVDLDWDKFQYRIPDSTRTKIKVDRLAGDGNSAALKFFGAVRTYEIITALKAGNNSNCTHGASAYWNAAAGNAEGDIMQAVEGIVRYSGIDMSKHKFGVLYPSKVLRGLKELDLIHNVTQRLEEYLSAMFSTSSGGGITFYPFTPYMDSAGNQYLDAHNETSSDALSTSALVFVEGPTTLKSFKYAPGDIPMTETSRVHDSGWITTLRHCFGCKVVPMFDKTNWTTTPLIYEITGVSA